MDHFKGCDLLLLAESTRARRICSAALCAGALMAPAAHAARPMVTDDARLIDPGACQVETWRRSLRDGYEFWALPSCNATGNLELTLGRADLPEADGSGGRAVDYVLQGKTLFREMKA